jgi:adenylate cyclase
VSGFCDRCIAAGLPLARALLFVDTLHPVHEGRLLRWGYDPTESPLLEYRRTSPGRARRIGLQAPGCRAGRALAGEPTLQDAANRRLAA